MRDLENISPAHPADLASVRRSLPKPHKDGFGRATLAAGARSDLNHFILIITLLLVGSHSTSVYGQKETSRPAFVTNIGHSGQVSSAVFSPDGRLVLSGGKSDRTAILWEVATGRELRRFRGHEAAVNAVAFSPDGKFVLTAAGDEEDPEFPISAAPDHSVRLWDVLNGREVRRFEGHRAAVNAVDFSPDGRFLVSGSSDRTVRLWETGTGRPVRVLSGDGEMVAAVAFSPDGKTIAAGTGCAENDPSRSLGFCREGRVLLWDAATGTRLRRLENKDAGVLRMVFSPDGKSLFTGPGAARLEGRLNDRIGGDVVLVRQWDIAGGELVREFKGSGALAVSPDGRRLYTGTSMFDLSTGRETDAPSDLIETVEDEQGFRGGEITWAAFSPDGGSLILVGDTAHSGGSLGVSTGEPDLVIEDLRGDRMRLGFSIRPVSEVAISGDNRVLMTGDFLWSIDKSGLQPLERHQDRRELTYYKWGLYLDERYAQGFSPDGSLFVGLAGSGEPETRAGGETATETRELRLGLWEAGTGKYKGTLIETTELDYASVSITADNRHVLVDNGGDISFIEIGSGRVLWRRGSYKDIKFSEFDRDRNFSKLVAGGKLAVFIDEGAELHDNKWVLIFIEAASGREVGRFEYAGGGLLETPLDGDHIAIHDSSGRSVRFLDATKREEVLETGLGTDVRTSWTLTENSFIANWDLLTSLSDGPDEDLRDYIGPETVRLVERYHELSDPETGAGSLAVLGELERKAKRMLRDDLNRFILENRRFDPALLAEMGLDETTRRSIEAAPTGDNLLKYNRLLVDLYSGGLGILPAYLVGFTAFSADGEYALVAVHGDSVVTRSEVWDVGRGRRVSVLPGVGPRRTHPLMRVGTIGGAAFSPDSKQVLVWENNWFSLWDAATGRMVRRIEQEEIITDAAFSSDGEFIITGSDDRTARLWRTGTGGEICRMIVFEDGDWMVVDPEGRFDTSDLETTTGAGFVFPNTLESLDPVIFARDYYEPGLLRRLIKGEELPPVRDISRLNRVQPEVSVTDVVLSPGRNDAVDVRVEVRSVSKEVPVVTGGRPERRRQVSGVFDLRLFRDAQLVGVSVPEELAEKYISEIPSASGPAPETENAAAGSGIRLWRETHDLAAVTEFGDDRAVYQFRNVSLPRDGRRSVEFTVYAFNADRVKSRTAQPYRFEIPPELVRTPVKGRAYIISIGVNSVEDPRWNLNYAANDARKMQEIIGGRMRAEIGKRYSEVITVPLISDRGKGSRPPVDDARKEFIRGVLSILAGRDPEKVSADIERKVPGSAADFRRIPNLADLRPAGPGDALILTFSGHGYAGRSGVFYVMPSDIGEGGGDLGPDLLRRLISSDELSLWMRGITTDEMIMVIDACHSAAAVQGKDFKPGPMGSRGLGQLAYDKDMKILSATQADNVALELESLEQGLLSYALLEDGVLEGKADADRDGILRAAELLLYAEERVPELYREVREGRRGAVIGGRVYGPKERGVEMFGSGGSGGSGLDLQRPRLFDFRRRDLDRGLFSLR